MGVNGSHTAFRMRVAALACVAVLAAGCGGLRLGDVLIPGVDRIDPPQYDFFSKQIVHLGIPIKAHRDVSDAAHVEARNRIARQLENAPDVATNLAAAGAEMHVIGRKQNTSDLPYFRHMKGKAFQAYPGEEEYASLDERARGMGGLQASCGEENLLKLPSDRYAEHRDICSHEFAHTILDYGVSSDVRRQVERQFNTSTGRGLWRTAYASTNASEFFAELSMWYFGSRGDYGRITPFPRRGRAWLRHYDPQAYLLLDAIYSGRMAVGRVEWRDLPALDADREGSLRSERSGQSTTVVFHNKTARDYAIFWLDFEGKRRPYGTLYAGGRQGQSTYATHVWVIADGDGRAVSIHVAEREPGKVVVR